MSDGEAERDQALRLIGVRSEDDGVQLRKRRRVRRLAYIGPLGDRR